MAFVKAKGGFTLIELMLVVIILGILAAMVVPNLAGKSTEAKITAAKTDIEVNLGTPLDLYEMKQGTYPNDLQELVDKDYLKKKKLPVDPWGKPYQYVYPGVNNTTGYDLYSFGPDGAEGGDDDITNWD